MNKETIEALNGVFKTSVKTSQDLKAPVVPANTVPVTTSTPTHTSAVVPVTTAIATVIHEPEVLPSTSTAAPAPLAPKAIKAERDETEAMADHDYARASMYSAITKADELVNKALEIAQQADHPRAIEVAAKAIDSMIAANEKLMQLHKVKQEVKQMIAKTSGETSDDAPPSSLQVNANNVVFTGSSKDLLDTINTDRR